MKKRNETKWSITKQSEIYQAKHKRSKNNQWRDKNQRNIEWFVRLFIDLYLDVFMLQNSKRSTKVMHHCSKYILNSLKHCFSFLCRPSSKGLLNVRKWTSKPASKNWFFWSVDTSKNPGWGFHDIQGSRLKFLYHITKSNRKNMKRI